MPSEKELDIRTEIGKLEDKIVGLKDGIQGSTERPQRQGEPDEQYEVYLKAYRRAKKAYKESARKILLAAQGSINI